MQKVNPKAEFGNMTVDMPTFDKMVVADSKLAIEMVNANLPTLRGPANLEIASSMARLRRYDIATELVSQASSEKVEKRTAPRNYK